MLCKFCGADIPSGRGFCEKCGRLAGTAPSDSEHEIEIDPVISVDQEEIFELTYPAEKVKEGSSAEPTPIEHPTKLNEEGRHALASRILTFGILGLVFTLFWIFVPLGFAFSVAAKASAARYTSLYGETAGRATVGKVFGRIGFVASIVVAATLFAVLLGVLGLR